MEVVLALALGLTLGVGLGAAYATRIAAIRRAALGTHTQLARIWPETMPDRSAADMLAGIIRIHLGGETYELPVLPRGASRRWLQSLDQRFADLAAWLDDAGDDAPAILARLVAESDALYDMLLAYDAAGARVLPSREDIDEHATDTEILRAVIEVWRAAHPLPVMLAESPPTTAGISPAPPSGSPTPTAGGPATSMTS